MDKLDKKIDSVEDRLSKKIDEVEKALSNKMDVLTCSVSDSITKAFEARAGRNALRVVKWVGGILATVLVIIFKEQLLEWCKFIFKIS